LKEDFLDSNHTFCKLAANLQKKIRLPFFLFPNPIEKFFEGATISLQAISKTFSSDIQFHFGACWQRGGHRSGGNWTALICGTGTDGAM